MRFMMRSECVCTKFRRRRTASVPRSWMLRRNSAEVGVADDAIRCDACPVLCYIKPGRAGSCDRYGNHEGKLVRLDPHVVLDRAMERGESVVPFLERAHDWDGTLIDHSGVR